MTRKEDAKKTIRSNIAEYGFHLYLIAGTGPTPKWAYTIGLSLSGKKELLAAGMGMFSVVEIAKIVGFFSKMPKITNLEEYFMEDLGWFKCLPMHISWQRFLTLGARDYFNGLNPEYLQIIPLRENSTKDVPNTSEAYNAHLSGAWKWFESEWKFDVDPCSTVVVDFAFLQGKPSAFIARWEEDQWQITTADPETIDKEATTVVSIGTALGIEPDLSQHLTLSVGQKVYRDSSLWNWKVWD